MLEARVILILLCETRACAELSSLHSLPLFRFCFFYITVLQVPFGFALSYVHLRCSLFFAAFCLGIFFKFFGLVSKSCLDSLVENNCPENRLCLLVLSITKSCSIVIMAVRSILYLLPERSSRIEFSLISCVVA